MITFGEPGIMYLQHYWSFAASSRFVSHKLSPFFFRFPMNLSKSSIRIAVFVPKSVFEGIRKVAQKTTSISASRDVPNPR